MYNFFQKKMNNIFGTPCSFSVAIHLMKNYQLKDSDQAQVLKVDLKDQSSLENI